MKLNIAAIKKRMGELEQLLSQMEGTFDPEKFKKTAQEHSHLQDLLATEEEIARSEKSLEENRALLKDEKDPEFQAVVQDDIRQLEERVAELQKKISDQLIPPDENDHKPMILEIRAGAGGQEAMLFVATCARMYMMYADAMHWKYEPLSMMPSDLGGLKDCVIAFSGKNVWRYLQHEAGTHRVQRVPETEAQGRVHTSTITVAALLDYEDQGAKVEISDDDLRIETTRSSGAGGQHVNKTDSAVRITHLPTGVVVFCQEERSQHKNKDKAMRLLKAKIVEIERTKQKSEIDQLRLEQVGTGDRSEKIRTYNFPQSRVTDHRIGLTKHNLTQILAGDLEEFSRALVAYASHTKTAESPYAWMLLPE